MAISKNKILYTIPDIALFAINWQQRIFINTFGNFFLIRIQYGSAYFIEVLLIEYKPYETLHYIDQEHGILFYRRRTYIIRTPHELLYIERGTVFHIITNPSGFNWIDPKHFKNNH